MLLGLSMDHRTATYSQVFTTALHGASVHQKTPVLKFGVATALLFLQPDSELLSSLISPSSLRLWVGVGVGVGGSCLWSKQHFASPRVTLLVQTPALTLQSCQPACACVHQSGHASPGAGGGGSVVREGARELLGGEGPRPHADREVLLGVQSRPSVSEGGSMRMVLILLSRSWGLWRGVDASGRGGGGGRSGCLFSFFLLWIIEGLILGVWSWALPGPAGVQQWLPQQLLRSWLSQPQYVCLVVWCHGMWCLCLRQSGDCCPRSALNLFCLVSFMLLHPYARFPESGFLRHISLHQHSASCLSLLQIKWRQNGSHSSAPALSPCRF